MKQESIITVKVFLWQTFVYGALMHDCIFQTENFLLPQAEVGDKEFASELSCKEKKKN